MFGIGPLELVIIALAAVIFVGPDKLPDLMKTMGRFFVQARRFSNDVRNQFQQVIDEAETELRQEELEELKLKLQNVSPTQMLSDAVGPIDEPAASHESPSPAAPKATKGAVGAEVVAESVMCADLGAEPQVPSTQQVLPQEHFDDPYLRGAETVEEWQAQLQPQPSKTNPAPEEAVESAANDGPASPGPDEQPKAVKD